jgi:Ca2+-transporting ATPase
MYGTGVRKVTSELLHSLSKDEVLSKLASKESGLTQQEAKERLTKFGRNELKKEKQQSPIILFFRQFTDILIIILLIATGLSLAIGEDIDALIIFAIVIASALLGFVEEFRSEKAVEALKKMAAPTAIVVRDSKEIKIPAIELVPGDVILLFTGDKVPADARILEAHNLKVDEASLTGESAPASKTNNALPIETQLNDMKNMVFAGTVVAYGRAKAAVVLTGMNTEFGKIAKMVQETQQESTPLEKRMASVGKWIGIMCIVVCIGVGSVGILEGRNIIDMLLWAVSLAVAAVPEALPAIVTGALAVGMYRMAKVNTIVKRLPAVETLGCTSVICSDKTGTMTKGEMTVQRIYVNDNAIKVSGIGYAPEGEFLSEDKPVSPDVETLTLLKVASLCNDSKLEKDTKTEKWIINGDPTEGALIVAAAKAGMWKEELENQEPRIAEIPFSSERKRMSTFHETRNGTKIIYLKGAPETVLEKCDRVLERGKIRILTNEDRFKILKVTEAMAMQALRNLGCAYGEIPVGSNSFEESIEKDLVFLGIVGMIDPPRNEVKDAIQICKNAGIRVVMITGDHRLTAAAVAKELNLLGENDDQAILTGAELEKMSDEQLSDRVEKTVIYARVSPEHKTRIVQAWKKRDQIVAMTGDGVNDAPALKMADIGIAMGITGTEVTKEAADMVLADDNFASIVKAVKEGREIYDNIKKYLTYLLRCNIMEILVMFIAVVSVPYIANIISPKAVSADIGNATVALVAVQLLWVNLTTDGLPAIALGVDPGDPDLMDRRPRSPKESIFTRDVKAYLTLVPILMSSLLLFGYFYNRPWEGSFQLAEARTQLLTAMILMELANALSARSLRYSVFKVGVFKNKFLWYAILSSMALQLVILYIPALQSLFYVHAPEPVDWAFAIAFTGITFGVLEFSKFVASKRRKPQ